MCTCLSRAWKQGYLVVHYQEMRTTNVFISSWHNSRFFQGLSGGGGYLQFPPQTITNFVCFFGCFFFFHIFSPQKSNSPTQTTLLEKSWVPKLSQLSQWKGQVHMHFFQVWQKLPLSKILTLVWVWGYTSPVQHFRIKQQKGRRSYKTGEFLSTYPTNQKRIDPSDPPLAKRDSWTGCHARAEGRNTCLLLYA